MSNVDIVTLGMAAAYTNKVASKLSEEFAKVVIVNENLINAEEVENGLLALRSEQGIATIVVSKLESVVDWYVTTGMIPIKAGETVTGYPKVARFAAFDEEMKYVLGSFLDEKTSTPYSYTATVDGFVRFCFSVSAKPHSVYYGTGDNPLTNPGTFVNGYRLYNGSVTDEKMAEPYVKRAFYGKTLMNFGDSIAAVGSNNGGGYANILAEKHNMTIFDYASGGATITLLNSENNVQDQIDTAITEHAGETIDYILLEGGTNDVSSQAVGALVDGFDVTECDTLTFVGAVETAIYKLRNAFPLAKIMFVSVHKMTTRNYEKQCEYHDALLLSCAKWSVPVVDVFAEGGINSYIDSIVTTCFNPKTDGSGEYDKTHPNAVGHSTFYVPMIEATMNSH